ncbi:E, plc [Phaffia rhodozyma]|uniref:E, plc n=1 Tax=Phaffia rhodozyma TaxID=264483 RepID=A0A0F7SQF4_PHARH|nr:E, plc [Phaffia rhodozyma]
MVKRERFFRNLSPFEIVIGTNAGNATTAISPGGSATLGLKHPGPDAIRLTATQLGSLTSPLSLTFTLNKKSRPSWTQLDACMNDDLSDRPPSVASEDTLRPCVWRRLKVFQKGQELLALSTPRLDGWMAHMPDTMSLGDISLPGTHQSTALYGVPVSQCQQPSTPLKVQLADGIRFLDVRLAEKKGKLIAYHGILTQRANFEDLLADVKAFLQSPESNRETVIMSINQENASTELFLTILKGYIRASDPSLWFLANRIPPLSQVRGKIVLFSRFGGDDESWKLVGGRGIHPIDWPNSVQEGFQTTLPSRPAGEKRDDSEDDNWGRTFGVNDWYDINTILSIPEKTDTIQRTLCKESALDGHIPLVFCSASSFPLAFPVTVARGFGWPRWGLGVQGVNDRMVGWLVERLAAGASRLNTKPKEKEKEERNMTANDDRKQSSQMIRGWILFDFYRSPDILVDTVVALNFC